MTPRGAGVLLLEVRTADNGRKLSRVFRSQCDDEGEATNTPATAVWTVGVFAALYAGYLAPEFRSTASNLSGVINGVATILVFAVVDPFLAMLTDDVVGGRSTEPAFRRAVVGMLGSRFVGTLLAQLLFVPAAQLVATLARTI